MLVESSNEYVIADSRLQDAAESNISSTRFRWLLPYISRQHGRICRLSVNISPH
jgi:hypothetical protein